MAHAVIGCISVTSNRRARVCVPNFQAACLKGDYAAALKVQDKLAPLHINLLSNSPAPVNTRCRDRQVHDDVRLPMCPRAKQNQVAVREAHGAAGPDQLIRPCILGAHFSAAVFQRVVLVLAGGAKPPINQSQDGTMLEEFKKIRRCGESSILPSA